MKPYTEFGVVTNAARGSRGMSWGDVAKAIGKSEVYLWKVMHGEMTSAPTENALRKLFDLSAQDESAIKKAVRLE